MDNEAGCTPLEIYADVTALASFAAVPFVPTLIAPACLLVGTTALCGSLAEAYNRAQRNAGAPDDFEPITGLIEPAQVMPSRWREAVRPAVAMPARRER